jgi:membrane-associated phospholipid phosphatase
VDLTSRFWHRPSLPGLTTFVLAGTASSLWFGLVYGACDLITAQRSRRVAVHFAWESGIPFVGEAVWLYMSIYALFLMAPFVLRSPKELIALGVTHASVVAVAAIGFLVSPAALAYPAVDRGTSDAITAFLYRVADEVNLEYNLLPSLHVALSVACVAIYATRARRFGQVLLWLWAVAISASTILTHFHHVLDAVTGFALGLAGARVVYPWTVELLHRRRGAPAAHQR